METISLDDDNAPPNLPDISVGSSVSSTMENEYNELIHNTFVVPQINLLSELMVPKVLENAFGLFSTRHTEVLNTTEKEDTVSVISIQNENELINSNLKEEKEIEEIQNQNKAASEMTIEKMRTNLDLFETTQETNLTSNNDNDNNNNNNYFQSITCVTDESSLEQQQKKIERFLIQNYSSNDENPRQNSPEPTSPPTNLDIDINETSSLDTIIQSTNYQTKSDNKETKSSKSLDLNNNNLINKIDKNVKIASCLDKWYKELKGQVLNEFEKSRFQLLQEQQKKLIEEKEKQKLEIGKLKKELDLVREQVAVYERKTLKKNAQIDTLKHALEKQCEKNEIQRNAMEWKVGQLELSREQMMSKLAEKYYNQRLKMKTFLCWHFVLVSRQRLKLEKACKKKAEEVCYELATKYELKIKKLEEELNNCKLEVEKYKTEIAKTEENTRKALMRGVCALNLEAMSILNGNDKTLINETDALNHNNNNNYDLTENFKQINEETIRTKNSSLLNEIDTQELSRRVKNFCDNSLNINNNSNIYNNGNMTQTVSLSKITSKQMNSNRQSLLTINPNVVSHTKLLNSCNKVFSELTEHNNIPNKPINNQKQTKSKIGSYSNQSKSSDSLNPTIPMNPLQFKNSSNSRIGIQSQLPAYRSFIIEKHTNINHSNNSSNSCSNANLQSNTTATKVKYAPPGQSATVLNTVISALAQ